MPSRIDLTRILNSDKPRLLFINLAIGGGTEKHVQELAYLLESRFEVFIVRPDDGNRVKLEWAKRDEEFHLLFALPDAFDKLARVLRILNVARIHFHHLLGHHRIVAQLPEKLGVPYDFTLHDYFSICPQFNLTMPDGRYCGEPDIAGCTACLAQRPAPWGMDIKAWRNFFQHLLNSAERVFGPSWDVINRIKSYYPEANFVYLPHPELWMVKVLVLGKLTAAKGGRQLELCARDARRRCLPLYFQVLGSKAYDSPPADMPDSSYAQLPLSFSGPYQGNQLAALIAAEQAEIIYFPAQWPETYSYTLSAAMRSGLPILAPHFGAFEERLVGYPQAHFINWNAAPAEVNDCLLTVAEQVRKDTYSFMDAHRYYESYCRGITASPLIKHAVSRDQINDLLKTEQIDPEVFDNQLKPNDIEPVPLSPLQEQSLMIQSLRVQIAEREDLIKALYASSSWRLTRPWRWLGWNIRRLKSYFSPF